MKKIIFFLLLGVTLFSCNEKTKIEVEITNAVDSAEIVISKLALNQIVGIDTIKLKNGGFKYSVESIKGAPDFYYIFMDNVKIASFVSIPGEDIKISTNPTGDAVILGSEESIKFNEVEMQFTKTIVDFNILIDAVIKAEEDGDEDLVQELRTKMGAKYVEQKKYALNYLFTNSKSISVIPIIYQKLTPELPIFGDLLDVFTLQSIYDSIQPVYPSSDYIRYMADEITNRRSLLELQNKVNQASETGFPDITLRDQFGEMKSISTITDKVILLSFWSVRDNEQKMYNLDLLDLYNKYDRDDFEVYQVSLDLDKASWVSVVKEQKLPWVSVSDPLGNESQYAAAYNIQSLPSIFLIDKNGDIVGRDIFDIEDLRNKINQLIK